jgi:hypothetical protein
MITKKFLIDKTERKLGGIPIAGECEGEKESGLIIIISRRIVDNVFVCGFIIDLQIRPGTDPIKYFYTFRDKQS